MTEEERAAFYDRRDVVAGWSHSALEKGVTARSWLSARSERCRTRSLSTGKTKADVYIFCSKTWSRSLYCSRGLSHKARTVYIYRRSS
ncbi:MAG: hypothetical protein R2912_00525 [Eubacteriales bacterium]